MKRKQLMAFLLAGAMFAAAGQSITIPAFATESEVASPDTANGISITENDSVIEISCTDPIVVLNDDAALITINGVKLDKEEGRLWYYYSIKNKGENSYIHPFFDGESFGDYMVDYSSYYTTGGTSAIPGGKWSALRGCGTENISSVNTIDDLKRFSATITLYINDNPNSRSSNDNKVNIPFDIDFDALDSVTRLSDTGEVLIPSVTDLPDDFQPEGAALTTTDEYAELTFNEPYVILDNDIAEVAITSLKLVYNDKIWYYYTIKNKTADKYLREFFDTQAFNDVMVDYSSYSSEGSSDSIPAGKNSGIKGQGSKDLTNMSSPADLLNFSGSLRIYPSDDPNSYGKEDPCFGAFSIQLGSDTTDTTVSTESNAADFSEASADSSEAVSAEDIDALLQGSWQLQGSNIFTFQNGSFTIATNDVAVMSGTYSVDTDTQNIRLAIVSNGDSVNASLPYTVENGILTLYNDAEEALKNKTAKLHRQLKQPITLPLRSWKHSFPSRL